MASPVGTLSLVSKLNIVVRFSVAKTVFENSSLASGTDGQQDAPEASA